MMFRMVVGEVVGAGCPLDFELILEDAVFDPVEPHVHGFGAVGFDGVVGDASGGGIVGGDEGGILFPSHIFDDVPSDDSFFAIDEEPAEFGFGGRRDYVSEDAGGVEDGAIVGHVWSRFMIAEVKVAGGAAAGVGFAEV